MILTGLSKQKQREVRKTQMLDLTTLTVKDVTQVLPGVDPQFNWQDVLFVLNVTDQRLPRTKAILVSRTQGFMKVGLSPNQLLARLIDRSRYYQIEIDLMCAFEKLPRPYPYVCDAITLAPMGNERTSNRSWVAAQYGETVNALMDGTKRSAVNFDAYGTFIVADSQTRLSQRLANAQRLHRFVDYDKDNIIHCLQHPEKQPPRPDENAVRQHDFKNFYVTNVIRTMAKIFDYAVERKQVEQINRDLKRGQYPA